MEYTYNCKRYQYESGEQIIFFHKGIIIGSEKVFSSNLNKTHDTSNRTYEEEIHSINVCNNRAKNKIYRIARSNKWDWFITLTFDRTKSDSSDYDTVILKLHSFLKNIKSRKCPDMKYLIVAELHKDKTNYHFHGLLANVDNLNFKYWKEDKKKHIPIYNIVDWTLGYTTATRVKDSSRVSSYITKYITKNVDEHLKEKRRYYYSRNCNIAAEEHFIIDEEDFQKTYADRIIYRKSIQVPQANQIINYYELKY